MGLLTLDYIVHADILINKNEQEHIHRYQKHRNTVDIYMNKLDFSSKLSETLPDVYSRIVYILTLAKIVSNSNLNRKIMSKREKAS